MWNVNTKVVAVRIGETGTISESFRKCLRNTPRKHDIKGLRKEKAIFGLCNLLRKVLVTRLQNVCRGKETLRVPKIVTTEWLQHYTTNIISILCLTADVSIKVM